MLVLWLAMCCSPMGCMLYQQQLVGAADTLLFISSHTALD
jgi:hypothetical protein